MDKFQKYVCVGDSITWTSDIFTINARIEFDDTTTPDDYDIYDEQQKKRWKNNEWFFCGVVLDVSIENHLIHTMIEDAAASLWGIEANISEDNDYLTEVAKELEQEALSSARKKAAEILKVLRTLDYWKH